MSDTDTTHDIVRVNTGDPGITIEKVHETETKYIVDAQREQDPSPRMFSSVGLAEVKLVAMLPFVPDHSPVHDPLEDAIDAVQALESTLIEERADDLTKQEQGMLGLGNIDVLPEVARSREPNRHDMMCPWCREDEDTYEDTEYRLHCFTCGRTYSAHERAAAQQLAEGNDTLGLIDNEVA